ncbi:ABC-2 transporter permease, partial [Bacillus cereus]|nr:ABC-2 transporter permease [Bacillus cereus]
VVHSLEATLELGVLGVGVLVCIFVSLFLSMKLFQEEEL